MECIDAGREFKVLYDEIRERKKENFLKFSFYHHQNLLITKLSEGEIKS